MFTLEELLTIQALCDMGLKQEGLKAVQSLVPLASKCGKLAKELMSQQEQQEQQQTGKPIETDKANQSDHENN